MLRGKGFYVWNADRVVHRSGAASPEEAAAIARQAGVAHAIVKIADGDDPFPLPGTQQSEEKETITCSLINALRAAEIDVWGWAFAYGPPGDPAAQARVFAARARHFGLSGLVIDAEDFGNRVWSTSEGAAAACIYVQQLRSEMAGVAGLLVGLSSYRYIRYHRGFPFREFMAGCDVAMPQVYWVARSGGDAVRNLSECLKDYRDEFPRTLLLPTAAAYGENQGSSDDRWFWTASPEQITRFLDQARALRLPAVTFWSWEHARHDPGNQRYPGTELWDTIAGYDYELTPNAPRVSSQPSAGIRHTAAASAAAQPLALSTASAEPVVATAVGTPGYSDGLHAELPEAALTAYVRNGKTMKYATCVQTDASVWALWQPALQTSGRYEIFVWIPAIHATSRQASYQVHGVVGEPGPFTFQVNQDRFFDEWVSLGVYKLDSAHPQGGHVYLTNATGEAERQVGFADIAWQWVGGAVGQPGQPLADGFDSPVGTEEERRAADLWPGHWCDATCFKTLYTDSSGKPALHTGADLNLNVPDWDSDAGAAVYAVASGVVIFAGNRPVWGNIVIIKHDPLDDNGDFVYSRSAHLASMSVEAGQRVRRGQELGRIGHPAGGPNHLHFDISCTPALLANPGDWPKLDLPRLLLHYVDPLTFIREHRP